MKNKTETIIQAVKRLEEVKELLEMEGLFEQLEKIGAWSPRHYTERLEHVADELAEARERERVERDEAREQNAKLLSIAERAIDDLRWFYESKADGIILELNKIKEDAK